MDNIYKDQAPNSETLILYVFNELSSEKETDLEAFLDANPIYADIVDGLLNYVIINKIDNKKVLLEKYQDSFEKVVQNLRTASEANKKNKTNPYSWLIFLSATAAVVLSILLFLPWPNNALLSKKERIDLLSQSLDRNSYLLSPVASAPQGEIETLMDEFQTALYTSNKDYGKALQIAESLVSKGIDQSKVWFFGGILQLYYKNNPKEAVAFLKKSSPDYTKDYYTHLTIAFVLNDEMEEAKAVYESSQRNPELPEKILEILNQ